MTPNAAQRVNREPSPETPPVSLEEEAGRQQSALERKRAAPEGQTAALRAEFSAQGATMVRICLMISRGAAGFALLIGLCVLTGWLFDIRPLMTVLPGLVAMKPNTAVAFCLGGLSLLFATLPSPGSRKLALMLAAAVTLLGALTLIEYVCGLNLRIDELLFIDYVRGAADYLPGRMSPISAFNFTILGLGFIPIHFRRKRILAQGLATGVALTSLLAVAGHFYGVKSLYQSGNFTAVALHTAIAFLALSVGLCCATHQDGFMRSVTAAGTSGRMLRRYGLAGILWLFLLAWLCLEGERQGWYGTEFSLVILGIANVVTFAMIIWVAAGSVRTAEVKETLIRERLRQARDEFEARVEQRTSELARANADLHEQVQERARAEDAYHQIMDHSLDVICTFDAEGRFVQVSRASEAVWGYRPEELIGQPFIDMVHPDDRQITIEAGKSIVRGASAKNFENRYLRRDGTAVPIVWTATWSEQHALQFCVARDVTERKRAEESMRLLESAVENITEAITITEANLDLPGPRIVFVNPAYTKMTGYTAAEAVGGTPRIMQGQGTDKDVLSRLRQTLERGEVFEGETINYRKDGTAFDLEWHVSPIRNGSGKITHFVAVQRDVTERRRAERELLAAKASAEAANRAKSEFLANMSHEIRTPMNGIIGMTELVLETELDRDQREYLEMAKFSAKTLLVLINDILDFSKIEAGKLELEAIGFGLRDCIGAMIKPLGLRADRKGLELTADIPASVPDHLVGDPTRLRQILINLTDNAIKFTERGDVMLRVAFEPVAGEVACLHFSVADTGVGIPASKQLSIFEAFSQADGTTTRTHGGTGLGLAIVSQLVRQMGGSIWVESVVGEGTTFHFTARLPVRPGLAPSTRPADPRRLRGVRVLVVDDNAVNRRILQESLANWRMQPTAVASGAAAIAEMLRAKRADVPFTLVILDGMMPEMDGFMVAEKIRGEPELAGVALMMLTSAMLAGASARCRELGVASYLTKPALQSELLAAILVALGGAADDLTRAARDAGPVEGAVRSLRILVAEDNLINWALASAMLEKRGHSLVRAENGRYAVDAVAREAFDLIFMDVQMPEMDGLEAAHLIREAEQASGRRHTPIVAMTAHALTGDRERCLAAGMDDYLSKPLEKDALLALIARVASNGSPAPAPTVKNGHASPAAPEPGPGRNAPPVFSREIFLDQLDGDEALMEKMILLFHENTPHQLDAIRGAIERRDSAEIARSAHALRGSLGVFGAHDARHLTQQLEEHADGEARADAGQTFSALAREVAEVHAALAGFLPSGFDPAVIHG